MRKAIADALRKLADWLHPIPPAPGPQVQGGGGPGSGNPPK